MSGYEGSSPFCGRFRSLTLPGNGGFALPARVVVQHTVFSIAPDLILDSEHRDEMGKI
jgi:hypothetical protein